MRCSLSPRINRHRQNDVSGCPAFGCVFAIVASSLCGLAHAQTTVLRMEWTDETHTRARAVPVTWEDQISPAEVTENYDNWRTAIDGGDAVLLGTHRVGNHIVADDASLVNYTGGIVTSMRRSIANMGAVGSGALLEARVTVRWYDSASQSLLRSFSYISDYSLFPVAPGTSYLSFSRDGFWDFLNVTLSPTIHWSDQYETAVGTSVDNIGFITAGPRNTGYSSRYLRDFTTGQNIDLGSDQINLAFGIRTRNVPSPSILVSSFLFGMSAVTRRRRSR